MRTPRANPIKIRPTAIGPRTSDARRNAGHKLSARIPRVRVVSFWIAKLVMSQMGRKIQACERRGGWRQMIHIVAQGSAVTSRRASVRRREDFFIGDAAALKNLATEIWMGNCERGLLDGPAVAFYLTEMLSHGGA